jgi:tetratricopeptide (TPR) repeat protein
MTHEDRLIGRTLGRYKIESLLGRGGLAVVYKATDLLWEMPVAVKVLPEFFATEEEHRQRFQREASTMANLVHPHIMPVRDYGQAEGVTYFVMDYAGGGTLEDRMGRPLSLPEAFALLEPSANAIAYAHRQGVVHRDLKPSNVLFDAEGRPLVADFGIAKLMEESGLTRTRESLGTPEYMAPEQAREAALVAEPADVYALGAILYELVTGQAPYQGNTAIDVIEKHKYAPIPSARSANPQLPPAFDEFCRRVLAKEPASRVQSVEEMMGLLRAVMEGRPLPPDQRAAAPSPPAPTPPGGVYGTAPGTAPPAALPQGYGYPAAAAPGPMAPPPGYPAAQPRARFPVALLLLAVVAVAAVAAVLYFVLGQPQPDKPYQAALACIVQEDWSCCIANLEQTLVIDAAYRDAATRLQDCRERQIASTQQATLEGAWSKVARCKAAGDLDCVRATAYDIAIKLDPEDVGARNEYAEASLQMAREIMASDPQAALGLLNEVRDLDVEALPAGFDQTFNQLDSYLSGVAAHGRGDWQEAIDQLTPILAFLDGRDRVYDSHVRLCQAALEAGDLETAQQEASEALALSPGAAEAAACAAGITDASYETVMAQARRQLDDGQWLAAIDTCQQALGIKPDDAASTDCIARAADGLYQESFSQGQDLLDRCRLDEAIAAFNQALSYRPGDSAAQAGIGQARQLQTPVTRRLTDSYDDWRTSQGYNGWYYLAQVGGATQEIPWGGDAFWWDRGQGSRIQQDGQHPGSNMDAVRRWRSPVNGTVKVYIQYRLQNSPGNTLLSLRQDGRSVWSQTVFNTNVLSHQTTLDVSAGTNLDLVLNSNGSQTNDFTMLRMTIEQQVQQCEPK